MTQSGNGHNKVVKPDDLFKVEKTEDEQGQTNYELTHQESGEKYIFEEEDVPEEVQEIFKPEDESKNKN